MTAADLELLWDNLLDLIEEGCVIPVVGANLLAHRVDGEVLGFQERLAHSLAKRLRLAQIDTPTRQDPTLNDVVCAYLAQGGRLSDVYPTLKRITEQEEKALPIPESLLQLAEVSPLKLFVTTTFDGYLKRAIDQVRYRGENRTRTLAYSPRGTSHEEAQDLDRPLAALEEPVVYHLLGRLSAIPHEYAVSDEDVLEFIYSLQARERRPKSLFQELTTARHQLLILGCSFPGWLARFFIRIAKGQPLSEANKADLIVDHVVAEDSPLVLFLRYFSEGTRVFPLDASDFVAELHRRWLGRQVATTPEPVATEVRVPTPAAMASGAVFISYASEDGGPARAISNALVDAGIDVWFDKSALQGGDEFERVIRRHIQRASLFVPILSKHTCAFEKRFFWREWRLATDVAEMVPPGRAFIVPVAIDNISPDTEALESLFGGYHWIRLPEGQPTPEFLHHIRGLFRHYQKLESGAE